MLQFNSIVYLDVRYSVNVDNGSNGGFHLINFSILVVVFLRFQSRNLRSGSCVVCFCGHYGNVSIGYLF